MNEIKEKIIIWEQRVQLLESQAREIEKKLLDPEAITAPDLDKIARIMVLSARAMEIDICIAELKEVLNLPQ